MREVSGRASPRTELAGIPTIDKLKCVGQPNRDSGTYQEFQLYFSTHHVQASFAIAPG